ncbi:hypothetical protein MMC25_002223 [Agyrium rufum]|nr:hypothetical protein [Agyrium rufum]
MTSHKDKLSLFRTTSARSQASLLESQDGSTGIQSLTHSYQPSPADSPLVSPTFPRFSNAVHSSPIDKKISYEDQAYDPRAAAARREEQQSNPNKANNSNNNNNPPRRASSLSQRSPTSPPPGSASAPLGQAAAANPSTIRVVNENSRRPQQQSPPPIKTEQKKNRSFFRPFSLGNSSSNPKDTNSNTQQTSASKAGIGRSQSTRQSPDGRRVLAKPSQVPSRLQQQQQQQQQLEAQQGWSPAESISSKGLPPTAEDRNEDKAKAAVPPPILASPQSPPQSPGPVPPPKSPPFFPSVTEEDRQQLQALRSPPPSITVPPLSKTLGRPSHHLRTQSSDQSARYSPFPSSSTSNPPPISAQNPPLPPPTRVAHHDSDYSSSNFTRDSRPPSSQSYNPPSPSTDLTPGNSYYTGGRGSTVQKPLSHPEKEMAPQPPTHGRSTENSSREVQSNRDGQNYGQPSQSGVYGNQLAPNSARDVSYRGAQPSPMNVQSINDGGRSTPPPARSREDLTGPDYQALLSKYEELSKFHHQISSSPHLYLSINQQPTNKRERRTDDKYRKVKKYYFDKDNQVQTLQNTLAHQRLAQSRTSLDDNEYTNRFNRLDGAINNIAFNIRKEWRAVPYWLAPHVNKDATTTTTKEMTAVGRACISRWIVDEIFDRFFHPALEPNLSCQLKVIERNLRRFAAPTPTDEERESLLAKISNWRLSTLDGLHDMLASPDAAEFRNALTEELVKGLASSLMMNLKEPTPMGLEAGVIGIVELAVGIAANIPLESRDVYVNYIMPGTFVDEAFMKVEGALPALTNPGFDQMGSSSSGGGGGTLRDGGGVGGTGTGGGGVGAGGIGGGNIDRRGGVTGAGNADNDYEANNGDEDSDSDDDGMLDDPTPQQQQQQQQIQMQQQQQQQQIQSQNGAAGGGGAVGKKKGGLFAAVKKGSVAGVQGGAQGTPPGSSAGVKGGALGLGLGQGGVGPSEEKKEERVRFAAFMAVEVRGRSTLCKAPVYI